DWLGANVLHRVGYQQVPFHKAVDDEVQPIQKTFIWEVVDEDGTAIKIGMFGAIVDSNPQDYVVYQDHTVEALEACQELALQTDVIVGLTHLDIEEDLKLAEKLPQVPLIMGGHDHHHMKHQVGNTIVAKADANAKSAYVHTLYYDKHTKRSRVSSRLIKIDDSFSPDPEVAVTVQKWNAILRNNIRKIFPQPNEIIYEANEPLDGRENKIRTEQTSMGKMFTKAMTAAAQTPVDCSIMNSGSVRIDDQLSGTITAFDIFRCLPYGGAIVEVEIKGHLLLKILQEGRAKKGKGAYLQKDKVRFSQQKQRWVIDNQIIDPAASYRVMITDYLLSGLDIVSLQEDSEGLLQINRPEVEDKTDLRRDIRIAIINYLKNQ
ncbi:MAG: 5'-nucleotidase C-terminal domain-containing protein, partial [Bacteroidota bacterium]